MEDRPIRFEVTVSMIRSHAIPYVATIVTVIMGAALSASIVRVLFMAFLYESSSVQHRDAVLGAHVVAFALMGAVCAATVMNFTPPLIRKTLYVWGIVALACFFLPLGFLADLREAGYSTLLGLASIGPTLALSAGIRQGLLRFLRTRS